MKKYIALLWLCCLTVGIRAAIQIKAAAPDVVEEGEQFRLSFTVNTQDVSNFHLPTLKGFSVDMGPSRSSQSSFQMTAVVFTGIRNALSQEEQLLRLLGMVGHHFVNSFSCPCFC